MGVPVPARRCGAPRHLSAGVVATLAAVAVLAAAASTVASTLPTILTQPTREVYAAVGDRVTLTVVAAPPVFNIQWQRNKAPADIPKWTNLPGRTGTTMTATVECPVLGAITQYRAQVCNAHGCHPSMVSNWGSITLRPPTWVSTPTSPVAEGANLTWVARAPFASLIIVGVRRSNGLPGGERVADLELKRPFVSTETGVTLRGASRDTRYWAVASAVCGGNHGIQSETVRSADVQVGPGSQRMRESSSPSPSSPSPSSLDATALTSQCPGWVRAVAADYDGFLLNNGAKFSTPSCEACRNTCRGTPGCDTWVYGADAANAARHRQCWLKKAFPTETSPVVKNTAGGGASRSPWVSGVLPSSWRCPGTFTADYEGRVLVRGDANPAPTCVMCRNACRKKTGCNVWVWGFKGTGSRRFRECWLKRWEGKGPPPVKAGSWRRESEWVGGVLEDRL